MKTVALVGMATTNRDLAPWDDEEIEIWTLNESPAKRFEYVKRVTRHFQLHPYWNFMRDGNQNDPEHAQWLKIQTFPIYTQEVYEDIPTSTKYPLEEIFSQFQIPLGDEKSHWKTFTSTFPYMIALAMYEGFERIEIYGFEMGSETEYSYQRPSVHLWLGIARGMFLATGKPEIYIPDECRLLGWGQPLYGYEMVYNTLNPMEIEILRNKFMNQSKALHEEMMELEGRQREVIDQMNGIQQHFKTRADEIKAKKQDPKLTERRLQSLQQEMEGTLRPLMTRKNEIHKKKMERMIIKERNAGAGGALQDILDRYNSQRPKLELMNL